MNARYITFILRMRLENPGTKPLDGSRVRGSVQQAGQAQIRHFDSLAEIWAILRETIDRAIRASVEPDDSQEE
jgi:hypothetical protein